MSRTPETEKILTNERLAVTLVNLNGNILYESPTARDLWGGSGAAGRSLASVLSVPSTWNDILEKAAEGKEIIDEPVLLDTHHAPAELCYLTVFPQRDANTRLHSLLCVWAARKEALSHPSIAGSDCGNYTRELEELLEHRTYQNLLSAEQNEFAGDVLDILPVGVLVISPAGDIVYRNQSMSDDFGLRPADYLQPNIQHFLSSELYDLCRRVADTGLRSYHYGQDPAGIAAAIDILPSLKAGSVQQIILVFTRPISSAGVDG